MVRERQVLIHLPDPKNMQVKAKINESRIRLIREGMPVTVAIGALGIDVLRGEVSEVKKYAEPGAFWSGTAKDYFAFVRILDPPPELRVGLTAEVQIHIASRADALQIPAEAVYERNGRTFCLVKSARGWDTRRIAIRSADEKTVALDEERSDVLQPGELVVVNPRRHLDKFALSESPARQAL